MPEQVVTLTPEQERIVLDAFTAKNDASIAELVRLVFPNSVGDGRSFEGRAIKSLIAARGLKVNTKTNYTPLSRTELNEQQKEFIRNNKTSMSTVEMARTLFSNPELGNLNIETRVVADYLRTVQTKEDIAQTGPVDIPSENYSAPKSVAGVLLRVDKYVFSHGINKETMTAQQKAGLEALLSYLNTFRFVNQINLYETQTSRDLFESSFVRYCYDKPDLTEEEVDQYINVSHDNVAMAATQARVERLSQMLDEAGQDSAGDRARISMSLVEAISQLNTELNQVAKRQKDLLGDLKQKRSDRLSALRGANASILNLVQLWKEEKTRKKLIHLADLRKKTLEKSLNELSGMEEIKCRIFGLDVNEVLNG